MQTVKLMTSKALKGINPNRVRIPTCSVELIFWFIYFFFPINDQSYVRSFYLLPSPVLSQSPKAIDSYVLC